VWVTDSIDANFAKYPTGVRPLRVLGIPNSAPGIFVAGNQNPYLLLSSDNVTAMTLSANTLITMQSK